MAIPEIPSNYPSPLLYTINLASNQLMGGAEYSKIIIYHDDLLLLHNHLEQCQYNLFS